MAKRLRLCDVDSFSTSPNSCHHTTVLNADVPNCCTTLKVFSITIAHIWIVSSIEGATWFNEFVLLNISQIFFGILLFTAPKYVTSVNSKQNTSDRWGGAVDRSIVDAAVSQRRRRLNASVCVRGAHSEHKFWQFWNELIILLNKPYFNLLCAI